MLEDVFKIAEANPIDDLPKMAAVIVDAKGKIVSVGLNQRKSHPLQKFYGRNRHSVWLHAEIDALRRALRTRPREEFKTMKIFVARVRKDGLKGKAAPCSGCMSALKDFGITEIYWTEDEVKGNKK